DVQRHENRTVLGIGPCRTIVKRRIVVALSGHHNLEPLCLKRLAHFGGEDKHDFALADAFGAARAQVNPAMRGVENNDAESTAGNVVSLAGCGSEGLGWRG